MGKKSPLGGLPGMGGGGSAKAPNIDKRPFLVGGEAQSARKEAQAEQRDIKKREKQATQGQSQLIQQLQGQAAGTAPSLAEAQLKAATNRNLSQQLAAAASQRGGGPGAQRQLMRQQGQAGREAAEAATQARMQEQQSAQQQLGGILAQEQASTDQLTAKYIQMGYDFNTAQKRALQDAQLAQYGARAEASRASGAQQAGITGGLIGAGGSILGGYLSDKTKKEKIKPAKKEISNFLDALSAREYEYKQPGDIIDKAMHIAAPEGKQIGIMAQDLEKSKAGRQMVDHTPHGKVVNPTKGFGAVLAAQAELHKRIKKLEKNRG